MDRRWSHSRHFLLRAPAVSGASSGSAGPSCLGCHAVSQACPHACYTLRRRAKGSSSRLKKKVKAASEYTEGDSCPEAD
eukprot:2372451-Pleurochrysis_carterae.AAC.1